MYSNRGRNARSQSPGHRQKAPRSRSRSAARPSAQVTNNSSAMKTHDENGNMIDHEPIDSFISDLDAIRSDEWRSRTMAFEKLVNSLPNVDQIQNNNNSTKMAGGVTPWYRSATALRRLHIPISNLLLDARSTVAKHTCQHMAFLVQRTASFSPPNTDICKYLMKDLLPAILGLHAQTVKMIKTYALDMMTMIIPCCRFKSGLPVFLERLRKDKSRDVREACISYLKLILKYWTKDVQQQQNQLSDNNNSSSEQQPKRRKEDYLTKSICIHVGNGIARGLMDSSQSVRTEARTAFEYFRLKYPVLWNQIVQKQDGILSKDSRLKKSILNAAIKADARGDGGGEDDEWHSSNSFEDDYDANSIVSEKSKESMNSWNSYGSFASKNSSKVGAYHHNNHKRSASVGRNRTGIRGSASRLPNNNNHHNGGANGSQKLPPKRINKTKSTESEEEPEDVNALTTTQPPVVVTSDESGEDEHSNKESSTRALDSGNNNLPTSPRSQVSSEDEHGRPTLTNHRQSSLLLFERLKGGENNENTAEDPNAGGAPSTSTSATSSLTLSDGTSITKNENLIVANQLLAAHKIYIDELMENLRAEMNVVRDFEGLVTKAKKEAMAALGGGEVSSPIDGKKSPTEEEVLNYYETVYGFLNKSSENGNKLSKAMDRISRSENFA